MPSKPVRRFDPLTHRTSLEGTSAANTLLDDLLKASIIIPYDFDLVPAATRRELRSHSHPERLLVRLMELKLLTEYQVGRIRSNQYSSLILGKYRILDRLGVGTASVVFRAEHLETRQVVAVKVMIPARGQDAGPLLRFFAERKTIAQLQHPNIVRALDVGEATTNDPDAPLLYYFVMEYVPGHDLEQQVDRHGPVLVPRACALAYEVAGALAEAHRHQFVHRDIKPANIILTPDGHAKLLDFGLVRQFSSRQTVQGTLLGVLEFIPPEQASDARSVDIRADIYSLGTSLFWCLTGCVPYPGSSDLLKDMEARKNPPPSLREKCPDAPAELDAVLAKMLAYKPDDRYQTPEQLMEALKPFLSPESVAALTAAVTSSTLATLKAASVARKPGVPHLLIVDDEDAVRNPCVEALLAEGHFCVEASSAAQALEAARSELPDLVLLDTSLPDLPGVEVLKQLRELPGWGSQKVIMMTRGSPSEDVGPLLAAGADDYLTKPVDLVQLRSRIKTSLQWKQAQDRADALNRELQEKNAQKVEPPPPPAGFFRRTMQRLFGKGTTPAAAMEPPKKG